MIRTSIEYAHIYTNQQISEEHETSVALLREYMASGSNNRRYSMVIMVDDYSFPDPSFSYDDLATWTSSQGFPPDLLIRESQLIPQCDEVLKLIEDKKLKKQLTNFITSHKYPCSLFIAAWYLLRLGKISAPYFPAELVGDELLNLLPESFKQFEDKALEIIGATPHRTCVEKIGYQFIKGRLLA